MKGEVNVWTNLRTLWQTLTSREFRPLRMAVFMQFVFIYVVGHLGYIVFHNYAIPALTATYFWTQDGWGSGASTTAFGSHPGNQSSWTYFYSKDSAVVVSGGDITLALDSETIIHTSDTDFNTGTKSNVYTTSTGASASIVLLKPGGAVCSIDSECSTNLCDGGVNTCFDPCVTSWSMTYSGVTYPLVEIGDQCWFGKSLNVGTKLASVNTFPSNNSLIEKWCYNNSDASCTNYGALYTWAEAMQLPPTCNTTSTGECTPTPPTQGICPSGFHIPTDDEMKTLEVYLGACTGAGAGCVDAFGYRGSVVGDKLASGGSSGFDYLLAGYRHSNNSFANLGLYGHLWLASPGPNIGQSSTVMMRIFYQSPNNLWRSSIARPFQVWGNSVRCLKD